MILGVDKRQSESRAKIQPSLNKIQSILCNIRSMVISFGLNCLRPPRHLLSQQPDRYVFVQSAIHPPFVMKRVALRPAQPTCADAMARCNELLSSVSTWPESEFEEEHYGGKRGGVAIL